MSEELTPEELAEYEASAAELIATAANPEIPAGRFVAVDCETLIEMIERKSLTNPTAEKLAKAAENTDEPKIAPTAGDLRKALGVPAFEIPAEAIVDDPEPPAATPDPLEDFEATVASTEETSAAEAVDGNS